MWHSCLSRFSSCCCQDIWHLEEAGKRYPWGRGEAEISYSIKWRAVRALHQIVELRGGHSQGVAGTWRCEVSVNTIIVQSNDHSGIGAAVLMASHSQYLETKLPFSEHIIWVSLGLVVPYFVAEVTISLEVHVSSSNWHIHLLYSVHFIGYIRKLVLGMDH